jgi:hypothetical protein
MRSGLKNVPALVQPVNAEAWGDERSASIRRRCVERLEELMDWAESCAKQPEAVAKWEPRLIAGVFSLGLLVMRLFLCRADELLVERLGAHLVRRGVRFSRRPRQDRVLGTFFGKLRYWRRYFAPPDEPTEGKPKGIFPVDEALGLGGDGFTMMVVSLGSRLATKMSFEAATVMLALFLRWSPAKKTIEQQVLGLGALAQPYQAQAPAPEDDGEVLIIQPDSKGIPTATEQELRRRRGPRKPNPHPESKRHRGRAKRRARGPRPRRQAGDKSKNARMATLVVMYTLRRVTENGIPKLLGPLNLRVYASFAPKKYAFAVARREAIKRGFGPDSGKLIQFVHDGDDDLDTYRRQYFGDYPETLIVATADLPHVLEYLWSAGMAVYKEGSGELSDWVRAQKHRLLASRSHLVCGELRQMLATIPKQGPGTKAKRERLQKALQYLTDNQHRLDYRRARSLDLELASGAVEGAVKHVIGQRFDHGGMRWIRERAEAVLQLRCIELNGDWDRFMDWVHNRLQADLQEGRRPRLRSATPPPLPTVPSLPLGDIAYANAA